MYWWKCDIWANNTFGINDVTWDICFPDCSLSHFLCVSALGIILNMSRGSIICRVNMLKSVFPKFRKEIFIFSSTCCLAYYRADDLRTWLESYHSSKSSHLLCMLFGRIFYFYIVIIVLDSKYSLYTMLILA